MNKKDVLILAGSLVCVAFLGYFTYSTISIFMKDKTPSQAVLNEKKNDTDNENKDKDSSTESSLNTRLEDTSDNSNDASSESKKTNDKNSQQLEEKETTSKSNEVKNTNSEKENEKTNNDDKKTSSYEEKEVLTFSSYLDEMEIEKYTLEEEESLSDVAKKFDDTCATNSSLNILKSLNQVNNVSALGTGDTVLIPVSAFEDGTKYTVKEGDTWYNLAREYYPTYNHEVVIDFLMDVNPFSNEILPLGEDIFLPEF